MYFIRKQRLVSFYFLQNFPLHIAFYFISVDSDLADIWIDRILWSRAGNEK